MKPEKSPPLLIGILAPGQFRVLLVGAFFLAGFLLLAGKLYLEQIQSGDEHREKISRQSIRRIRIPARRGRIFSSDLRLLAGNQAENNLVFYPEEMRLGRRSKSVRYMLAAADTIAAAIGRKNPLTEESVIRHLNTGRDCPLPCSNSSRHRRPPGHWKAPATSVASTSNRVKSESTPAAGSQPI